MWQHVCLQHYLIHIQVIVGCLQCFGSIIHSFEHRRVGVCTFQRFSLHLYRGQSSIYLLQLLVVPRKRRTSKLQLTQGIKLEKINIYLFFLFRACRADLLFVLAFFLAVATSWSIFFSKKSFEKNWECMTGQYYLGSLYSISPASS